MTVMSDNSIASDMSTRLTRWLHRLRRGNADDAERATADYPPRLTDGWDAVIRLTQPMDTDTLCAYWHRYVDEGWESPNLPLLPHPIVERCPHCGETYR